MPAMSLIFVSCSKYHWWKTTFLLPWAALIFAAGFAMREWGAYEYDNLNVFISSIVLILAAPPLYAAAEYVILGRLLYYVPWLSPIHPGRVITTFLGLGAVTEALTANGAAIFANRSNSLSKIKLGSDLIKAALILQALIEVGFLALVAVFYSRCKNASVSNAKMRKVVYLLFGTSLLILARCIFRVVEVFESQPGEEPGAITKNEWPFWVFETGLMIICTYWLNWHHPAQYLPKNFKLYLSSIDKTTEIEGPGWVDKRPLIVTLFDPFDLVGLAMRSDEKNRFWENETVGPDGVPVVAPTTHPEPTESVGMTATNQTPQPGQSQYGFEPRPNNSSPEKMV
ncbi:MAG: hypothetical protein M1833_000245 [Piccolia ochrophora]|nr:MAG: hypothetical protein M1833_000245 [Piccolia ochrophora]